jgi:hypothetical protein
MTRFSSVALSLVILGSALPASAQCFNRTVCNDPSLLEIRSQVSVTIPLADKASTSDTMKAMEDARRDLYALSNRECDTLKGIYGGDCTLSSVNISSTVQDRGGRGNSVFVSINNTYELKKSPK